MEKRAGRLMKLILAISMVAIFGAGALADTISFQNGFNGYEGTVQTRMSTGLGDGSTGGSLWDPDFVMCKLWVPGASEGSVVFWRFDNIIGATAGQQIPANATILSARLELRTCSNVTIPGLNPPLPHGVYVTSPGPMFLARMLVPVDEARRTLQRQWGVDPVTNNYYAIKDIIPQPNPPLIWVWYGIPEGPDYAGGDYDRPAGGFIDMTVYDRVESADVTSIVQAWVSGQPNNGFIMVADVNDYWVVEGTGHDYHYPTDFTRRPKLVVEYDSAPAKTYVFQQGKDGYSGCSTLRVGQDDVTTLGSSIDPNGATLQAGTGPADPEYDALMKFDGLFGDAPGQIPAKARVIKAYVSLTTVSEANDANGHSPGPFSLHKLQVDVDWTGANHPARPFLWSEFNNADGPTVGDELSAAVSNAQAMAFDGQAFFDVTSTVQAWKAGATNYGLAIKPGTTNAWKCFWNTAGEQTRPQLVVMAEVRVPDLNKDTFVDTNDFSLFAACAAGPGIAYAAGCSKADFDYDSDVDATDFAILQACWSESPLVALPQCRW